MNKTLVSLFISLGNTYKSSTSGFTIKNLNLKSGECNWFIIDKDIRRKHNFISCDAFCNVLDSLLIKNLHDSWRVELCLVYGMWEVHKKFGSMPWEELLQPAIELADSGFEMSP